MLIYVNVVSMSLVGGNKEIRRLKAEQEARRAEAELEARIAAEAQAEADFETKTLRQRIGTGFLRRAKRD